MAINQRNNLSYLETAVDSQRPSAPERPVPVPTVGRAPYTREPLIQHGLTSCRTDNLPKDQNSRRNKGGTRFVENEKQLESQTTPAAKLTAASRSRARETPRGAGRKTGTTLRLIWTASPRPRAPCAWFRSFCARIGL